MQWDNRRRAIIDELENKAINLVTDLQYPLVTEVLRLRYLLDSDLVRLVYYEIDSLSFGCIAETLQRLESIIQRKLAIDNATLHPDIAVCWKLYSNSIKRARDVCTIKQRCDVWSFVQPPRFLFLNTVIDSRRFSRLISVEPYSLHDINPNWFCSNEIIKSIQPLFICMNEKKMFILAGAIDMVLMEHIVSLHNCVISDEDGDQKSYIASWLVFKPRNAFISIPEELPILTKYIRFSYEYLDIE